MAESTVSARMRPSDRVWREDSSSLGNPQWSFTLGGTVYRTAANSSVGYDIDNHFGSRRPVALRLTLNSRGRVVGAAPLTGAEWLDAEDCVGVPESNLRFDGIRVRPAGDR